MAANPATGEDALGIDLGTSGGSWLFKDQDLLMGPVPADVLIAKLNAGEISPDTSVANEDDGEWKKLRDVPFFTVHVARVEARSRVLRDKRAFEQAERRQRTRRVASWALVSGLLVVGVASGSWWWVTHDPLRQESEELAALGITVSPPIISLASKSRNARESGEAWLDVDDVGAEPGAAGRAGGKTGPASPKTGRKHASRTAPGAKAPTEASGALAAASPQKQPDNDVGLVRQYDMNHINNVVQRQSRTLFPCIKAEVQRTGFKGSIPFEFVIRNDGRVGKIWIDNKELRGTPLESCFQETMAKWRFNPFAGERPTVTQSFTVGG